MIKKNNLVKVEELQQENTLPQILDFWVDGCGPCNLLSPFLDELSKKYEHQIQIIKLNAQEAKDLQMQYRILAVPTLIFLKDDEFVSNENDIFYFKNKRESIFLKYRNIFF